MDSLLHFRFSLRLTINCQIIEILSNYNTNQFVLCSHNSLSTRLSLISDLFFNGISGSQKDCDLPKATTVLHGSNFGQLQSSTSNVTNDNATTANNNNNTRLHVSNSLCDSHNMHQDQVNIPQFQ